MLTLGLLALLVVVALCSQSWGARIAERVRPDAADVVDDERSPAARAWSAYRARRRRPAPLLPEGHRPPAGLGPLSPSERFLQSESARGIKALQLWLIDQDGAAA